MKCGEPILIETFGKEHITSPISEEWTYNFGPGKFLYFVKFRHGRVIDTEYGDYGY